MRIYLLLIFIIYSSQTYAQGNKRANVWYFGYNAGLDFNKGTPVAITDGALSIWEGCATICDENGALLFYTDGSTAWNKNHKVIPNAVKLGGNNSSSQSGIIVPYPGHSNLYYIFSVDSQGGSGGVQYALVDMNLNGGLGGIVTKNSSLLGRSTEKLTAVRHCNNRDFWVVMHEIDNNVFRSFLIDNNGLNLNYTKTAVGSIHQDNSFAIGYMKASPNGKKLALASYEGFFEILDFDNSTGKVSAPITLKKKEFDNAYSVEFSSNSKILYMSQTQNNPTIYQIDLSYSSGVEMLAKMIPIGAINSGYFGALQAGPDGKIYVAINDGKYLGIINNPNVIGLKCNFVQNGIFLGGKSSGIGLPNLITSYFIEPIKVSISSKVNLADCNRVLLESTVPDSSILTYQWYKDGQLIPGAQRTTLVPTQSGKYQLKVETSDCVPQKAESNVVDVKLIELAPKSEAKACGTFLLSANANSKVEWNGLSITASRAIQDTLLVTITGKSIYKVKAFSNLNNGCFIEKEIQLDFSAPVKFNLPQNEQFVCGKSIELMASPSGVWNELRWQMPNGSIINQNSIKAEETGPYIVLAKSSSTGCSSQDTVTVNFVNSPPAPTTKDISICSGENLPALTSTGTGVKWYSDSTLRTQVGSGNSYLPAVQSNRTGSLVYYVTQTISSSCVSSAARVLLTIKETPVLNLGSNTYAACFSESPSNRLTLDAGDSPNAKYSWAASDGHILGVDRTLQVQQAGEYLIKVTNDQQCSKIESIIVVESCTPVVFVPDVFTPNGDGLNDRFEIKGKFGTGLVLTIYDRWGEVINRSTSGQWDGVYMGQPCSEGLYYWKIEYTFVDPGNKHQLITKRGQILLAR
ncbi:T9SS type B sorting domain-containing protein [Larkinella rosea]|uniref:Gliding motility-associated C-terminal domain-containing protein n=1 Tax=Larkinella rosea TaxID=2025312 RepID=A0A3P1BEN1_9BACT|nr:gliding motility-associated C-terminal domain-containing protein [Larkinella rosea]RRA99508.1 gliding motility-associated C-terminal domain-containing protein [Larkinella rosea]